MQEQIIHTMATVIMEIAYLVTGIILCVIGKRLLEEGISGKFLAEGEVSSKKLRIITSSPGLVFLVAGLVIVSLAIYTKSEFKQLATKHGDTKAETKLPSQNRGAEIDLNRLVEVMTSYSLAAPSEQSNIADKNFSLAIENAESANWNKASEYLVRAISFDPSKVERALKEQKLRKLVQDSFFVNFARSRLQLALRAQREQPLSDQAMAILAKLDIFAGSLPQPSNISRTKEIIASIPTSSGQETSQKTLGRMKALLKENPKALHSLLREQRYRWIFQDPTLLTWLQKSGDTFFREIE